MEIGNRTAESAALLKLGNDLAEFAENARSYGPGACPARQVLAMLFGRLVDIGDIELLTEALALYRDLDQQRDRTRDRQRERGNRRRLPRQSRPSTNREVARNPRHPQRAIISTSHPQRPAGANAMSNLLDEIETKAAQYMTDVREVLARHETQVDHAADDVKALLGSPVGQAVAAAVHVPDTVLGKVAELLTVAEAEYAKIAGSPPASRGAPAAEPVSAPSAAVPEGPVVGGQAF